MSSVGSSNSLDFSNMGTYQFDGQKAPASLQRFQGEVQGNPKVEFQGTTYTVQNVVDYDSSRNGEYIAGHLYVPNSLDRGSFFVSENGELYHDGSQYLRDKDLARTQGLTIEQYRRRRRSL